MWKKKFNFCLIQELQTFTPPSNCKDTLKLSANTRGVAHHCTSSQALSLLMLLSPSAEEKDQAVPKSSKAQGIHPWASSCTCSLLECPGINLSGKGVRAMRKGSSSCLRVLHSMNWFQLWITCSNHSHAEPVPLLFTVLLVATSVNLHLSWKTCQPLWAAVQPHTLLTALGSFSVHEAHPWSHCQKSLQTPSSSVVLSLLPCPRNTKGERSKCTGQEVTVKYSRN